MRPIVRRSAATGALTLALLMVVIPTVPASAHPGGVSPAVDYRTRVTGMAPAVDGVRVRFVADGSNLELSNSSGRTVEILGYQNEPMFQVRPDGVWRNVRSPSLYLDRPDATPREGTDPAAQPEWQRASGKTVVRWQDHRALWHGRPPPAVQAAPGEARRIRDWSVPLRAGDSTVRVTGTLDWVPLPNAPTWWSVTLLLAAGVAVLGLVPLARSGRQTRVTVATIAVVAACAGLAAAGYPLLVVWDNAEPGAGRFAVALLSQALPVLSGLGLLAAAGAVVARRAVGDLALAFTGACVAFFAGANNAPVFSHGVAPIAVDGLWARLAEAAVLAGGVGLVCAGVLRIRQAAGQPALAGPPDRSAQSGSTPDLPAPS